MRTLTGSQGYGSVLSVPLLPEVLSRKLALGSLLGLGTQSRHLKSTRRAEAPGKRRDRNVGVRAKRTWGGTAGARGKTDSESAMEKPYLGKEGRGREVPRKAQPLGLSLGCIFIRSRGCTDGLSIEFHLQHHQRLILYSLLILP